MAVSLSETKEELVKKFNNPYIISFVFSWVVWNWEGIAYFIFHDAEIINKMEYVKSVYFSWGKSLLWPILLSPLIVLFVNAMDAGLDYLTSKLFTERRLNQRVKEKDFTHDRVLHKHQQANDQANRLIEEILKKIEKSHHIKRRVVLETRKFNQNHSKLESDGAPYHKFIKSLNEVLSSDYDLLELIYNSYGKHTDQYCPDRKKRKDLSDSFDYITEKEDFDLKIDFKHIQF